MKCLAVIPTYNENANIESLIRKILEYVENIDILIIDDNSPDGTGKIVEEISKSNPRVKLFKREGKKGLGSAYLMGFKYALQANYDVVFEMDADFSHDPMMLPVFIEKIKESDLVVGSRYLNGISVVNWPLRRLILSLLANFYIRLILNIPVKDCTSGFKCFRKEVLNSIDLDKIKSEGYSFQIEMNYYAFRKGFKIEEIPIIFVDRHSGFSKMSRKIALEALFLPWKLKFLSWVTK
ncbi:MAG: polyprenol monophosphomannose synthase [Candidatus Firestonebacteria bacterium]